MPDDPIDAQADADGQPTDEDYPIKNPPPNPRDYYITIEEAALLYDRNPELIRQWIARGWVPGVIRSEARGKAWLIPPGAIAHVAKARPIKQGNRGARPRRAPRTNP